jgi:hypothetical protein
VSEPKRCCDCKHLNHGVYDVNLMMHVISASCRHPNNASLVDGRPLKDPQTLRYSGASTNCGQSGLWWEPREVPKDIAEQPA